MIIGGIREANICSYRGTEAGLQERKSKVGRVLHDAPCMTMNQRAWREVNYL